MITTTTAKQRLLRELGELGYAKRLMADVQAQVETIRYLRVGSENLHAIIRLISGWNSLCEMRQADMEASMRRITGGQTQLEENAARQLLCLGGMGLARMQRAFHHAAHTSPEELANLHVVNVLLDGKQAN